MKLARTLLCASALGAALTFASGASAQKVDRIVAFGDSYADDGNLFELLGIPRPDVYPNGRFSNGTNFVDTMARLLNIPVDNFAIGGAFTGNGNINGPGIPGFVTEYQSFLAGGGPAAFPRVTGKFDSNDLVVVSIGGNDARAYERSLGLNPTAQQISGLIAGAPAQASARVAEATAGLSALVNAGARNITFLAGDVGRLPEVRGLPVASVGTAYASAFNDGIKASLAGFADQGVIVNYLDLNLIGDVIEGNLAAFGLTSTGACPIACVTTNPELLDRYLFYVDQVHMTSAGFAIVGRYAVRQLEAPLQLEGQSEVGLQAVTSFGSNLGGRLDLADSRFGAAGHGRVGIFLSGHAMSTNIEADSNRMNGEVDTSGLSAGAEYAGGGAVFGAALNWSRGESDIRSLGARTRAKGWQAGLYGGWSGPSGAFVQAYATYGQLDFDIHRPAVIDDIAGDSNGKVIGAGAKAGWLFDLVGARIGPVIGLRYAEADIDGYTEAGDPVLTLNVRDHEAKSLVGHAGVELRGTLDVEGLSVRPFASAMVEREFEDDPRTVLYALTAAPNIVNQWVIQGRSDEIYGRLTGGISFELGRTISLQAKGTGTVSRDGGDELGGSLGLRLGF